jgi:hypothetical protein
MPAKGEADQGMDRITKDGRRKDGIGKLISARLRRQTPAAHPDADVLSAFAEKALSEPEQGKILAHVAECPDCRDIVFLSLPNTVETQAVVPISPGRSPQWALRWGTLVAAIAVCALLLVSTRHRNASFLTRQQPQAKTAPTSAELKMPSDVAEMHALHEDRANAETSAVSTKKIIPTPKHMTAPLAAKLDFDANGEVRISPGADAAKDLPGEGGAPSSMAKLNSGAAAAPQVAQRRQMTQAQSISPVQGANGLDGKSDSLQTARAPATPANAGGVIGGTVLDPSGAVIPNASVMLQAPTGTSIVQSDSQGRFSFDRLSPGSYSVKAEARGFKTTELPRVAVANDRASDLRLILDIGAASETVEISAAQSQAEAPPAAKTSTALVAQEQTAELRSKVARSYVAGNAAGISSPQWTLSPTGSLQRSFDSGKTWHTVAVGHGSFRALSSAGSQVWVGGNAGTLYHSADSGHSWTQVTPAAADRKLSADVIRIDFANPLNGTVRAVNGELWTTSDGGESWQIH